MKNAFTIAGTTVVTALCLMNTVHGQNTTLTIAEQNAIVQKYCVACHDDAKRMGGLTLQKFDAAAPDPSVAGMMVNKLDSGAMGAAGIKQPDPATTAAMRSALAGYASKAIVATGGWTFKAFNDPATKRPLVTATMRQEVSPQSVAQLTITCQKTSDMSKGGNASRPAEMQLTLPATARDAVSFEVDGRPTPQSVSPQASATTFVMPLPSHSLTIRSLFPGETISFPFSRLTPTLREIMSTCVEDKKAGA